MKQRFTIGCLVALWAVAIPVFGEWPQFRGPGGAGVALEAGSLPESWGPETEGVRWRTEIPGDGISSPIVADGRVFLTTAYESPGIDRMRTVAGVSAIALTLLFLILFGRERRRRRDAAGAANAPWEARIVTGVSLFFVLVATVLAARPELIVPVGNPGRGWRIGGAIALLGVAAAFGWLRRGSALRLVGLALVATGAAVLLAQMPPSSYGPMPLSKSLPLVIPALALGLWLAYGFVRSRRTRSAGDRSAPAITLILLLLAGLSFAPSNLLSGLERVVVCLDVDSGEILWERTVLTSPAEKKWPNSSYATPTPATDGELVFAYFGHGLAALDYDGNVLWSESFPEYMQHTRYGASSSPVLTVGTVVLGHERELDLGDSSWLAAWDKRSGRRLWSKDLPDAHDSYSTPLMFDDGTTDQLLTPSWNTLVSYDVESGERLWSVDYPMEQMVASMGRAGDLVAVTGGAYGDRSLMVWRLAGAGAGTSAELLWQSNRGVAEIASPVIYADKLFSVNIGGILTVYDAVSGSELWKKRLDGEHYASLVAGDGKVYATNTEGRVTVISASDLKVLAVNDLDGQVYASPGIANGCLLIRTADSLVCVAGSGAPAAGVSAPPEST